MITNNFKNYMRYNALKAISASDTRGTLPVVTTANNTRYLSNYIGSYTSYNNRVTTSRDYSGIQFGSGTTQPTANDHSLESMITSGFNGTVTSTTEFVDENGAYCFTRLITVTNTSSADITISEVGQVFNLQYTASREGSSSSDSSNQYRYILIDRTLLDTPVTIPPSSSATITYTIKIGNDSQS